MPYSHRLIDASTIELSIKYSSLYLISMNKFLTPEGEFNLLVRRLPTLNVVLTQ